MPIIIDTPLEALPADEQEQIWRASRTHEVFVRDANGELWQVLDLTTEEEGE
jgi:hypothetical protein